MADPAWPDPVDPNHSRSIGGRWNPPGSFGVVYLCRDPATARANVFRLLAGLPYGPEDLAVGPDLVSVDVPEQRYVDAVTKRGLASLGLPGGYPTEPAGTPVPWRACQPIGLRAWERGELGIAARSAAPTAPPSGEELAHFARGARLTVVGREGFDDWFW